MEKMTTTQDALDAYQRILAQCEGCRYPQEMVPDIELVHTALTRLAELEKAADGMAAALHKIAEKAGRIYCGNFNDFTRAKGTEIEVIANQALAAYHKLKGEKE